MQGKKNRKKMYPRDEKVKKRIKKIKRMLGEKIQKKKTNSTPHACNAQNEKHPIGKKIKI
jgi:hypothetical protein